MNKEDMVHIHNGILLSVRQKKTNIIWYHLYVEPKKSYKWTYLQNSNRVTDVEKKLMVTVGRGGWAKLEDWDWHIHTDISDR